jgi:hypothetical protein
MNLTVTTESAELQFKQILEEFFISNYDEKSLPSHGIDHHRRVWKYAKELLTLLAGKNTAHPSPHPSKLIIASYLHDIGMSVETGIRHGKHSRDLCIRFLEQNHLPADEYHDVLSAVENHDRKEYTGNTCVNDLLTILSVSDDLDAFGFTGIFRYSEIYLTRGINLLEIGRVIKVNAGMRFDNFNKIFGFADLLVMKHKKRYDILDSFFSNYDKQAGSYQFGVKNPWGYCGVMEMFTDIVHKKTALEDICRQPGKFSNDPVIGWFFNELASELLTEHKIL